MSAKQKIIFCADDNQGPLLQQLQQRFEVIGHSDYDGGFEEVQSEDIKLILFNTGRSDSALEYCRERQDRGDNSNVPVVLLSKTDDLQDKLKALEVGCDDYILESSAQEEILARLENLILHKIANEQLLTQVKQANEMAMLAMTNISDLGANLQFFEDTTSCTNLDELGILFFQLMKNYGLDCSLQIRSEFGIKNMEANGLQKELESQLLNQLKEVGRFYDFGHRTIINYGRVSILVKNMPVDDEVKYGSLKDNIFTIAKGMDSRVRALDNNRCLALERDLMRVVSTKLHLEISNIDNSYQDVMRDIVSKIEDMVEKVEKALMYLGLTEEQERVIENIIESCLHESDHTFKEGLRIDEGFRSMIKELNQVFNRSEKKISITDIRHIMNHISQ